MFTAHCTGRIFFTKTCVLALVSSNKIAVVKEKRYIFSKTIFPINKDLKKKKKYCN